MGSKVDVKRVAILTTSLTLLMGGINEASAQEDAYAQQVTPSEVQVGAANPTTGPQVTPVVPQPKPASAPAEVQVAERNVSVRTTAPRSGRGIRVAPIKSSPPTRGNVGVSPRASRNGGGVKFAANPAPFSGASSTSSATPSPGIVKTEDLTAFLARTATLSETPSRGRTKTIAGGREGQGQGAAAGGDAGLSPGGSQGSKPGGEKPGALPSEEFQSGRETKKSEASLKVSETKSEES